MPAGIPVATVAINGAQNAGLLAIEMISLFDEPIKKTFLTRPNRKYYSIHFADICLVQ